MYVLGSIPKLIFKNKVSHKSIANSQQMNEWWKDFGGKAIVRLDWIGWDQAIEMKNEVRWNPFLTSVTYLKGSMLVTAWAGEFEDGRVPHSAIEEGFHGNVWQRCGGPVLGLRWQETTVTPAWMPYFPLELWLGTQVERDMTSKIAVQYQRSLRPKSLPCPKRDATLKKTHLTTIGSQGTCHISQ